MTEFSIKEVNPDDPNYEGIKGMAKPKCKINYKLLAQKIDQSPEGTILKVAAPVASYSNIKLGLRKRGIQFDIHYSMVFDGKEEAYYLTIKE